MTLLEHTQMSINHQYLLGWHILWIIFKKSSPVDKIGLNWLKLDKSGEKWIKLDLRYNYVKLKVLSL